MTASAAAAEEEEGEEEEEEEEEEPTLPPTPHAARHSAEVEHAVAAEPRLSTSEKARTAPGSGEESKARASPRAGAGREEAAAEEAEARRKETRKNESDVSFLDGDGKGKIKRALLLLLPPRRGDNDDFVPSGMLFCLDSIYTVSSEEQGRRKNGGGFSFLFVFLRRGRGVFDFE